MKDAYGPAEATVWSTLWERRNDQSPPPIGKSIPNTQNYLLDGHHNIVPIGVSGEAHIGGAGIARGYLGRPDLTAEKFVPDWLGQIHGRRLYRTGDLARYLADGNIEFINRMDTQVNIPVSNRWPDI